jgi:hypothetical protein
MTMWMRGVVCRRGPVVVSADVGRCTEACPEGECRSGAVVNCDFMQVVSSSPPGERGAPGEMGAGIGWVLGLQLLSKSLGGVYALCTRLNGASSCAVLW